MIRPVPELPTEIIDAINNKNLAIFIGAGVSRLIGCDSWDQLAKNLIDKCSRTNKPDGNPCINYREKSILSNSTDYKKIISICYDIFKKYNYEELFFEQLEISLKKDQIIDPPNIYSELYNFLHQELGGISGLFVTTNADEHFDEYFNKELREIVYNPDEFIIPEISRKKLYHIHGSISDRKSLVFTVSQYLQRYNHKEFVNVLREIFDKNIVLFIGYGLDEFEVIDFLISKLGLDERNSEKIELKNFLLSAYFSFEEDDLAFDQLYYRNLGITVLGYEKDQNGYEQLYNVIKKWNEDIIDLNSRSYESYEDAEEVIKEYEDIRRKED